MRLLDIPESYSQLLSGTALKNICGIMCFKSELLFSHLATVQYPSYSAVP